MTQENKNYVTREELLEKEMQIQREMMVFYDKNSQKIDTVDGKVDDLKDLVLPLVESSKATANNTEKIATSLDIFINKQTETNGDLYSKISNHRAILAERKGIVEAKERSKDEREESKEMKNSTKGLVITGVVGITLALIEIAPAIASILFQ